MAGISRYRFCICTVRRKRLGQNIGGSEFTIYVVDTTPSLFLNKYIKSKRCGITLWKWPMGKPITPLAGKTNDSIKGNKPHARNK